MSYSRLLEYISNRGSLLALGIFAVLLIHGSVGQHIYLSGEMNEYLPTPAAIAATPKPELACPENMKYEPAIDSMGPFCECADGYLYHRKSDNCYERYTRGPCKEGKHFILKTNATKARCVRNPCPAANTVMFGGSCHELLRRGGPCGPDQIFSVSDQLYKPVCIPVDFGFGLIIVAPRRPCRPGTRKAGRGKCRLLIL